MMRSPRELVFAFHRIAAIWVFVCAAHASAADALSWQSHSGYRSAPLTVRPNGKSGFTLLSPTDTGLYFTNQLSDFAAAQNRVLESGSGVALGDIDGDGLCDIYLCRLEGDNALYRNLGNWKFEDITAQSGVACPNQFSTGAILADVDGDGDLDLLVNCVGGGTRCYFNDGKGHFTEVTDGRLVHRYTSTSMALADMDGDGDLDLYVANYSTTSYRDRPSGVKVEARRENGKIVITPPDRFIPIAPRGGAVEVIEMGERDYLYLNDGRGRFLPISWTNGAFLDEQGLPYKAPPRGWGLSVMFRDLNGDGLPDLYVCNDFFYFADDVWFNVDGKAFRAVPSHVLRHVSLSSMAIDVADLNRDGHDDFFVVDMVSRQHAWRHRQRPDLMGGRLKLPLWDPTFRPEVPHNTLFLNRGDETWTEIAQLSGLENTEWSWGAVFLDVDLDGWEDLLIANGNNHDVQDADVLRQLAQIREETTPESRLRNLLKFDRLNTANLAFRNQHDLTFKDLSQEWGFHTPSVSHGMALADLDNDGDLDVVVNNLHAPAGLYRNNTSAPRIAVRLKGDLLNTRGIGAKIELSGGPVTQTQEMISGGRYLSSDDPMRVFAATPGTNSAGFRLKVTWRTGKQTTVTDLKANTVYEVAEAGSQPVAIPQQSQSAKDTSRIQFKDVSALLNHTHVDQEFNDFDRQPLLAHSFAYRGPGLGWIDINSDGWTDLVVGSGRGASLAILRNNQGKSFTNIVGSQTPFTLADQAGVVGFPDGTNGERVLVALENYEDPLSATTTAQFFDGNGQPMASGVETWPSSAGPMAIADCDGDGDLDVFIGGRLIAGKHPQAASSRIYRNEHGQLIYDEKRSAPFANLGLVSGAVFTDLDGDGAPELVLACEWGPVRIFTHLNTVPEDITESKGLAGLTGWWNGVQAGDFDGDGRMDLIASNWGRNTRYQSHLEKPLQVHFGDFRGRGIVEELEAYYVPELGDYGPWRDWELVTHELPWVRESFSSYRAFGQAKLREILGERAAAAHQWNATTLDSVCLINRGDHFDVVRLPFQAQCAPAFGIAVADFDSDGHEDVFLSQNFFGVTLETSRYDGGRGVVLKGDGHGGFEAVETGIAIYGEQRGAAVGDFNHDGRPDLAVAQNRGATKLFANHSGRRGWRIQLKGPASNPRGIGAVLRLGSGNEWGPAREIHGGGGYWSQDDATQVMASSRNATHVRLRWPGGKTQDIPLPSPTTDIVVPFDGR